MGATHPDTLVYNGTCYHAVQGKEKQNWYFVGCDKDNNDYGFNQLNCEVILKGKWDDEPSCDLPDVTYIQPKVDMKPAGIPKFKRKVM